MYIEVSLGRSRTRSHRNGLDTDYDPLFGASWHFRCLQVTLKMAYGHQYPKAFRALKVEDWVYVKESVLH